MTDPVPADDATLFPKTAGERLREAREAQGLSLAEIAARTRVPLRQLEAIESDNYGGLPSVTYAVGFAKAYARAVGEDEAVIARDVRNTSDQTVRRTDYEAYEIDDPKRTPSGGVMIGSIAVVVLLLVAIGLWYGTDLFRGTEDAAPVAPTAQTEVAPAPAAQPTPEAPVTGQVVLTATDEVWLRIYDATGKTLFENTLQPGERYEVPADANGPMINVGRPDKLQVTLNGSALPPLGDGRLAIKDVGISAVALTARGGATTPAPAATPAGNGDRGRTTGANTSGTGGDGAGDVPSAFRAPATRTRPERSERRPTPPVVTRPNGGSPAETLPAPITPAPAPTSAPAGAP